MNYLDIIRHRRNRAIELGQCTKGMQYSSYMASVQQVLKSHDPSDVRAIERANNDLLQCKDVGPVVVHNDTTLSDLSIQYANDAYIGETLMPIAQVNKKSDVYFVYDQRNRFAYPDDQLGARGEANEINENRSTDTYSCLDYGYENFVSGDTIANQDAPLNELVDLTEAIAEGLAFRREKRIATVLTTGANYGANTTAIGAADRWDTTAGGDPIADVQAAIAALFNGMGTSRLVAFTSLDTWNVLSRHPSILDLFKFNGSSPGLATPTMFAQFLGLDDLLVGKAREDTANEGAAANYARIWGDSFGVLRVQDRPSTRNAAFGVTFRNGAPSALQWFDQRVGVKGGWYAKVSTSEAHKVTASPTGFLITTPIN